MAETIYICAHCQSEFPEVKEALIKASKERDDVVFSHGICIRHYSVWMKELGKSDEDINDRIKKGGFRSPDFKEHPELVKQYSQGVFTPEDYKKAQFPIDNLKEFLQRRAGMKY